jgi:hypothetical protein
VTPRIALVAAVILVVGACSQSRLPEPSSEPDGPRPVSTATAPTATSDVTAEPRPAATPLVIADPALPLSCGGEERFPAGALGGVGQAELETDAPAAVLRSVIAEGGEPDIFPADGWHRVVSDLDTVVFVALGPGDPPWVMVEATRGPDGWTAGGYGACDAQPVLPAGISMADFWLDPAAPAPAPGSTTLNGVIVERACANGKPPTNRVRPPIVVYEEQAVTVTVTVSEIAGGADCPSNPPVPITIELSQPLGERTILDGSVFPPRDTSGPPA